MLSIGEFSKICEVSTKTLRYYDEIGLITPSEINPQTGYRYYSITQLETMLFINRLKTYNFSLEEMKVIMNEGIQEENLYLKLKEKQKQFINKVEDFNKTITQLDKDMNTLKHGKSIMSYLENIDVQLVEVPTMCILSIRKKVHKDEFPDQYGFCFHKLFKNIKNDKLTITSAPMVLFHSDEFTPFGLDTEFAIPVKEITTGTRDFQPGLCLKTTLYGAYTDLPSIYTKQCKWAQDNGYVNNGALYEVYITDPSMTPNEDEYITEIYCPVKKITNRRE